MDWKLVKQPNGLYAWFVLSFQDFTILSMTNDTAWRVYNGAGGQYFEFCNQNLWAKEAERDVFETSWISKPGTNQRWKTALRLIEKHHGRHVREIREQLAQLCSLDGAPFRTSRTVWERILAATGGP